MGLAAPINTPAAPSAPIRVMIVDDHPIFRDRLTALLMFYKRRGGRRR
jgi:hypothetical protein